MLKETMKRRFCKLLSLTPVGARAAAGPSGTAPAGPPSAKEGARLSWLPQMLSIQTKEALPFRGPFLS